jgi:hypothetical protein
MEALQPSRDKKQIHEARIPLQNGRKMYFGLARINHYSVSSARFRTLPENCL